MRDVVGTETEVTEDGIDENKEKTDETGEKHRFMTSE